MVIIKGSGDFESVQIDEWITGSILDVEHRLNENKKVKDKLTGEMTTKSAQELRLILGLDGYAFNHNSRWLTASMNKESNFYKNFVAKLMPDVKPNTDFDSDELKGMKVKVMYENTEWQGKTYQNISAIRPLN